MKDERKTKKQLIEELQALRLRLVELEAGQAGSEANDLAYRALVEQSLLGLLVVQDYHIAYANEAAARISGYGVEELMGLPVEGVKGLVHPDDRETVWGRFEDRLKGKPVPSGHQWRGVRKDGAIGSLETYASLIEYRGKPAVQVALLDVSERRQAEEGLGQSKAMLGSVLSSIDDLVFVIHADGVFLDYLGPVSGSLYRPEEEFLGRSVDEVLPAPIADQVAKALRQLEAGAEVEQFDYSLEVGGERREWSAKISARRDGSGHFEGATAVIRETTERRRVEEALRESEQLFRSMVETAPSMLLISDAEGKNTYVSPQCEEMLGYAPEELEGRFSPFVHEDDSARAREVFSQALEEKSGGRDFEYKAVRKDGGIWYASSSWEPLTGKDGEFAGFVLQTRDITAQKRAEEELRESEERYRRLVEGSFDGIAVHSEGKVVFINEAGAKLLGASQPGEIIGRSLLEFILPDQVEAVRQRVIRQPDSPAGPLAEATLQTLDGREVQAEGAAIRISHNGQPAVLLVFRDITERKQAREDLQVRISQMSALTRGSLAVTASLEVEAVLAEIVSLATEVAGADTASAVLVDELGRPEESADNVPGVVSIEYRIRDHGMTNWIAERRQMVVADIGEDGAITPALGDGAPAAANPRLVEAGVRAIAGLPLVAKDRLLGILYLHSSTPGVFAGQVEVLTAFASQAAVAVENARLYEALRDSQRLLERTIASLRDAVFVVDAEAVKIVDCNPAASHIFGYSSEEMLGRSMGMLYEDDEAWTGFRSLLHQAIEEKGYLFLPEFRMKRKSGQVFPGERSVLPLTDSEGRRTGWVSVVRDITQRKSLEEQMRRQERLAAVGRLAGGIAHDFNNYLSTIMLYAGLVAGMRDLPGEALRNADVIIQESQRAAALVQQVLDFSRRSVMEIRRVDLVEFVEEAAAILRRTLPESISLRVEAAPDTWAADADPARIQQVLMNLVLNARDAMPDGGDLAIALENVTVEEGGQLGDAGLGAGEWVCLSVSDTGTGIPAEALPHIYEPFFTTKGPGLGVGLGLPQVYGIVVQHGGHIAVDTEVGEGTTFRIYLPAHGAGGREATEGERRAPPRGRGETILLVEDDEGVRDAMGQALESLGYRLLSAANGREALELYDKAEGVDLVLTDVVMPELGGEEFIQELKQVDPDVRVVAMTGYAPDSGGEGSEVAGAVEVLHKPLEVADLGEAIREVLDGD
jgi:two-component system cell cycle sensor histidine kinase/response regulator CckA